MQIKQLFSKKNLLVVLFILLTGYVLRDIAIRVVNHWRWQGYALAVNEMIQQAGNEECLPFSLFTEEKQIRLINLDCLPNDLGEDGGAVDFSKITE